MKINLISVVGEDVQVLPHLLRHYRNEGVTDIMLHVHGTGDGDPILARVADLAKGAGAEVASKSIGKWWASINTIYYANHRLSRPHEWFVIADADEFHGYHGELIGMIDFCERNGYDYIEGCFIDRLADGGLLPRVSQDTPIWDQFPLGGMVSTTINGAIANKIVAAKGHVRLGTGQHVAGSGRGCPPEKLYVPVYHFKWIDGIMERLAVRAEESEMLAGVYKHECRRFLSHYLQNAKIDLTSAAMMVAPCAPHYLHWETVWKARVAAKCFHPALLGR
ncbi:MAG: hypothetical protein RIS56_1221 [Verrucomicrobiota bacterium]|jgi:hypothetical protein